MAYIHGTATKITVCIDNSKHPLIIDSGAHCSIVARNYLNNHFPNWERKLLPTKAKNFKIASGKMKSIGEIIKQMIIPHMKGNIRLNSEFFVLEDAHIQRFYWEQTTRGCMALIFTTLKIGILLLFTEDAEEHEPAFAIGEEPLCKFRGHDIQLYLDVERPYPPILRGPSYPASLETRKEIEKNINELLEMDVIRKIGHNEIVEITTPVLINWRYGKARLCGDFRALNSYTKAGRYPIPRIPHALDKLAKAKYITKMYFMKGFHQNLVKPNSMKLLRII
ncbi:hypothetical protein O181_040380 [Austropuccinia psidii MF-1]|uniref:Uncharacterized protein n=1 Tax=Austropuccinia psidii MF-1 TaxID=1389203 RepID=A0A9Q3HG29_9BASI|nr:hypothetical protein [Austropuccinia psidii MF-1]